MNKKFGKIFIRYVREDDALSVIQVHYDSVHHVASKDYPIEILDEWSPPISEERIAKFLNNGADVKLVAERDGHIIGFGELLTDKNQLGAVYVASSAVGQGVGKAIMTCLHELAVQKNVPYLEMESSVTAFPFYQKLGYIVLKHGTHRLSNGLKMACVSMRKDF
jgi:putative acetyltransferase